jgi:hypothetical protein
VYFFQGRHDVNAPAELVQQYFDVLNAPAKELVWFEHSGHSPWINESDRFVRSCFCVLTIHIKLRSVRHEGKKSMRRVFTASAPDFHSDMTCDILHIGDPEAEVKAIAACFMADMGVIKRLQSLALT